MPEEITMPKLSDTMEEGTLLKWYKQEGDYVQQGETLFEVETDKAVLEVEAFASGILSTILVKEGEKVPVGTPIAIIGGEEKKTIPQPTPPAQKTEPSVEPQEKEVPKPSDAQGPPVTSPPGEQKTVAKGEGIHASPAARNYAHLKGIDLTRITGTGEGGMITLKDARDFRDIPVAKESPPSPPQRTLLPSETITDLSNMRKAIAATVSYSKQHIPHFYVTYEVDMTNALDQLKGITQSGKEKITINDLVVRAVATTLKNYPYLNAIYPEQGLILKKDINIGVVMGLPEGLIIPVLKNCDSLTLEEISQGIHTLREKAESGKFSSADFADGTFSISNMGMLGVSDFAAIIYPPQTAILAVSAIKDTPVIKEGAVVATALMKVTLSVDHRVVDGVTAANFLRDLKKYLETEELTAEEKPCCIVEDD